MSISPTSGVPGWGVLEAGRVGNVPMQVPAAEYDRFQQALQKAGFPVQSQQVEPPVRIAQLDPVGTATDATTPADAANAANRAVRGLELDGEAADTPGAGTTILEGLGRLRGVFDSQFDGVVERTVTTNPFDMVGMMQLQAEVVEFSLLVDVTSKLAGKSTQALDSLMKGQ